MLRYYNKNDIRVSLIHADNEFRSIMSELVDVWDVEINFSMPGEHVPDIERMNRTLQERFRVALYRLPYKIIPKVMIVRLTIRITRTGNMFPAAGGISRYFAPSTIITGKQIDFLKELVFSFGDYGQGYYENSPKNNNLPRTKDCIYLQSAQGLQRGHEVMNLATGEFERLERVNDCFELELEVIPYEEAKPHLKTSGF